jgi:Peptidase propeptide and YPEB domain
VLAMVCVLVIVLVGFGGLVVAGGWNNGAGPTPPGSLAPGVTPARGLSRAEAIAKAALRVQAIETEIQRASASVEYGGRSPAVANGRRVWVVTFTTVAGPTSGRVATVYLDFFSGEVLDVNELFA